LTENGIPQSLRG